MPTSSPYAVVIGSSAGGIESLKRLAAKLPGDFAAPLFIAQHVSPDFPSFLPQILNSAGPIKARHPLDGERVKPQQIYVAPPDHHLLIEDEHVVVKRGPKENRFRPSIDALFRSAAYTYRSGAIGVVLSGSLSDGTSGLWTIKRLGGTTIVQDPSDALVPSMPMSALKEVQVDRILPIDRIADALVETIGTPPPSASPLTDEEMKRLKIERAIAAGGFPLKEGVMELGKPSHYACPECSGVMNRIIEGPFKRYRCHTGHAYTQDALLSGMQHEISERLARTITALEESAMLLEEIGKRSHDEGDTAAAENFSRRAAETREILDGLRQLIVEDRIGVGWLID
jgi:two-component system, chemotaxis family, protein-glutamate methylesterase/glutaminase